jgi:hypothetical protein
MKFYSTALMKLNHSSTEKVSFSTRSSVFLEFDFWHIARPLDMFVVEIETANLSRTSPPIWVGSKVLGSNRDRIDLLIVNCPGRMYAM